MKEKELLRSAMEVAAVTQIDLQRRLKLKSQSSVSSYLNGTSMRVDTFTKLLSAMGFTVKVVGHGKEWIVGETPKSPVRPPLDLDAL